MSKGTMVKGRLEERLKGKIRKGRLEGKIRRRSLKERLEGEDWKGWQERLKE